MTKKQPKKEVEPVPYRTCVRFSKDSIDAVDRLVRKLGMGDRSTVIRYAVNYGLKRFLRNPTLVHEASKIKL